jgi:SAM-dependent methyltransferase
MESKEHWEKVYQTKAPDAVSWFAPHLETSLKLIEKAASEKLSKIIDVGGGESTLVDDLLTRGYQNISVLDISQTAIDVAKRRLGNAEKLVQWYCDDIAVVKLPDSYFDVWHDRAVFHFLTNPEHRLMYVKQVLRSVKLGGHIIVSTFGPEGPEKCSGLDVIRYDADELHDQFGGEFKLIKSSTEIHQTPFGTDQQFLYCYCRLER